jgi:lysyl-tRNA synthetase class 2
MSSVDKYILPWKNQYTDQIKVRIDKRVKLESLGISSYKNGYSPSHKSAEIVDKFQEFSKEELVSKTAGQKYSIAGRLIFIRDFGKAAFAQVDDGYGKIQIYIKKGIVSDDGLGEFQLSDVGDVVFVKGEIFKTDKGEVSLKCDEYTILTKSLRPLPEKFHGLSDPELRYRLRYVDFMTNPSARVILITRSKIVQIIRNFFHEKEYLEVETPMLHDVAQGAIARPFETHHNSLNMDMFLRIAPELHLKRLIVGGLNRVFELNRCFRNEGLSLKHNPEFTTIEFYQAYATFEDFLKLTEELMELLVLKLNNHHEITFGNRTINFSRPFKKLTMREAVSQFNKISLEESFKKEKLISILKDINFHPQKGTLEQLSLDSLLVTCFEETVEKHLINPTFITDFPTEISPLSRRNDKNPDVVDRFELYINGWEIANAFSELNDPHDQLQRFAEQALNKEKGDLESCEVDYDFIRALEFGMPPTAGEGIGIDRLVMILTNSSTIRDVLCFPQLKRETFFMESHPKSPIEEKN